MQTHCHSCGAETFPGTRFCRRCGAPVGAAGGEDTGGVSQMPGTVPLREEEGHGRTTDGLAPGEEQRPAAQTTRVSRADLENLLRSQPEAGGRTRPEHDPNAARLGRDQTAGERDDTARDPEATPPAPRAVTRPEAPAAFGHDEDLTVTVPRPVVPTPAAESAPLAPPPRDGRASAPPPGARAAGGARARRRWPLVVAACVALLLFTVAAAWLAYRLLHRPTVTGLPSEGPAAAEAGSDARRQFDEKLAQAEALLAQGNMDEAVARLREANALDPSNVRAHRRLGELLLASGARREAVEEFRAVTRNAPEDAAAWRQLATAQFAEGLYRDAAESYRRLVALVGDSADPSDLLSYADALRLSGRTDEARSLYQRVASAASADAAEAARQRLAELAREQPTPGPRPGEQAGAPAPREEEMASNAPPAGQPTPAQPAPTPQPTPTPQPARAAAATPAEHYRRGVELWSSNRGAALVEFRAAAAGGSADAPYYLGLSYVEGKNLRALKRAELVAALQYFQQAAQRGGEHAGDARRYAQELEREFDRLRNQ